VTERQTALKTAIMGEEDFRMGLDEDEHIQVVSPSSKPSPEIICTMTTLPWMQVVGEFCATAQRSSSSACGGAHGMRRRFESRPGSSIYMQACCSLL
jgi:hypothetical protein